MATVVGFEARRQRHSRSANVSGLPLWPCGRSAVARQIRARRSLALPRAMEELAFEDFSDQGGVGFAFAGLHHLALEKVQRRSFAGPEIRRRSRVGRDSFLAEFL